MKTICAVINQKGGTGKTTTTHNAGAGLRRLDHKVLLIDLDPQTNLTTAVGCTKRETRPTIADVLRGKCAAWDAVYENTHGPDLIAGDAELAILEKKLSGKGGGEVKLKNAIESIEVYDYALIDCPPSLGMLSINAIMAADFVLIPCSTEFLALQSLTNLLEVIGAVRPGVPWGVVCTRADFRKTLHRDALEWLADNYGNQVFDTVINETVALQEAPSYGEDIFTYRPNSRGAEDYAKLSNEILTRGG